MIQLIYGNQQQFRFRHNDINILGYIDAELPVRSSVYFLNDGSPVHFYVEPESDPKAGNYPYRAKTPSIHRLRDRPGYFNIEIPIDCPKLKEGWNQLGIQIEDREGKVNVLDAKLYWDSRPLSLPIDLRDLSKYQNIQEIGQVVNGEFDIDPKRNVIRSRLPVGADILLLLGSPCGSQEAIYDVRFTNDKEKGSFIGVSDFFAGHEEQFPELGIKPGYSTAGLATITPTGWARTWMAVGDCLTDKEWAWVVKNKYPAKVSIQPGVIYSVRHQVIMGEGINYVRYRIWRKGCAEPRKWLCEDNNSHLGNQLPRITQASFGLFQYGGLPTEWSNIFIRPLDIDIKTLDLRRKNNHKIKLLRKTKKLTMQLLDFLSLMSK